MSSQKELANAHKLLTDSDRIWLTSVSPRVADVVHYYEDELTRLREAIEKAPHDGHCGWQFGEDCTCEIGRLKSLALKDPTVG